MSRPRVLKILTPCALSPKKFIRESPPIATSSSFRVTYMYLKERCFVYVYTLHGTTCQRQPYPREHSDVRVYVYVHYMYRYISRSRSIAESRARAKGFTVTRRGKSNNSPCREATTTCMAVYSVSRLSPLSCGIYGLCVCMCIFNAYPVALAGYRERRRV